MRMRAGSPSYGVQSGAHQFTDVRQAGRRRGGPENLCAAAVFGMILFVASLYLFWWNEGNSVEVYESLAEARAAVIEIVRDGEGEGDVPLHKGNLVHITDRLEGSHVGDAEFAVGLENAVRLTRVAEMMQWREHKRKRKTGSGRNKRVEVTYSYRKEWSSGYIDSSSFAKNYDGLYDNPLPMPYSSNSFLARSVALLEIGGGCRRPES
mmetsp:Transcript_9038/g.33243  ORF Transcript_9038/g.33243 Transcript_9038/m.33243 type:complete len:208 (-) Transcript_9038:962-1585(-)